MNVPTASPPAPVAQRCAQCGAEFSSESALTDHVLRDHVEAPTPAEHIRRRRANRGPVRIWAVLACLLGVGLIVLFGVALAGAFNKDEVPATPASDVHKMAVELVARGDIEEFTPVVPEEGFDVEYELDQDGSFPRNDGVLRARSGADAGQGTVEYEAFDDGLANAIEDVLRDYGYLVEGG